MSTRSSNYVVVQNGVDAARAAMEGAGPFGVADERGAQTLDDDDVEARKRAMRRDPDWASHAAAAYDAEVGAKGREVNALLVELKESQDEVAKKIRDAEEATAWADAIEGARDTMDKLPEYALKAREVSRRMRELRQRLEKVEARVSKFS
jgi:chromosome segregation ATPase